jgi:hypothetical protein
MIAKVLACLVYVMCNNYHRNLNLLLSLPLGRQLTLVVHLTHKPLLFCASSGRSNDNYCIVVRSRD